VRYVVDQSHFGVQQGEEFTDPVERIHQPVMVGSFHGDAHAVPGSACGRGVNARSDRFQLVAVGNVIPFWGAAWQKEQRGGGLCAENGQRLNPVKDFKRRCAVIERAGVGIDAEHPQPRRHDGAARFLQLIGRPEKGDMLAKPLKSA
jgi:hypothetical protein